MSDMPVLKWGRGQIKKRTEEEKGNENEKGNGKAGKDRNIIGTNERKEEKRKSLKRY
jgi:hypothetical protein